MKLFVKTSPNEYTVTITNPIQFRLYISQIKNGCSFRQAEKNLTAFKTIADVPRISSVNDTIVANHAHVICTVNLQRLTTIFRENKALWAFSLANDATTHYGSSYLDNRIRIHLNGKLYDLYVIAIPIFERHTADNIYHLIVQFLNIICSLWRQRLLGIAADSANVMTDEFQGVITHLEQQTPHKVYRIWCGLHQLDLVMKHAFKGLMDGEVVKLLKKFIHQLREQSIMISQMGSKCPNLTIRWVVIGKVVLTNDDKC